MVTREEILHYIWKFKFYDASDLKTNSGESIEVIDCGVWNQNSGPDFFNAKVIIDGKKWAGNIEIHRASDEWVKHQHHTDTAYNSVILHVVEKINQPVFNEKGEEIPQLEIKIPTTISNNIQQLFEENHNIACCEIIPDLPKISVNSWLSALSLERLERKTKTIFFHLERYNNSWEETLYVMLARNFGFGLNSDEFERVALSLPLNYIKKHNDNLLQIESLLFGQAGMLENENIKDKYYNELRDEYHFLSKKFSLKPLNNIHFKSLRVRPQGFPHVRIAQLAALFYQTDNLFSKIIEKDNYKLIRMLFQAKVSPYWLTHYTFGKESPEAKKFLSDNALDIILINTVVPILFAYGKKMNQEVYCDRALQILEELRPEKNSIISDFKLCGIKAQNAMESQALIQLYKEYCVPKKCIYCRFGHIFLSKKNVPGEY